MGVRSVLFVGSLALSVGALQVSTRSVATPLSLDECVAQIDHLISEVRQFDEQHPTRIARVLDELPDTWSISTSDRLWTIPAEWLRHDLETWQRQPEPSARVRIADRLLAMRSQLASFQVAPANALGPRATLAVILSAREFRHVQGPTWFEQLRARVMRNLLALFGHLAPSVVPTLANVVVYALIGLAVSVIALWMYRSIRRTAADELTLPDFDYSPPRSWNGWLTDARAAAAAGDWRQATRLAYWCGIAFLEAKGAWRADPSRTPREYLRLLTTSHEHWRTLRALTHLLERVWYGTELADATSFDEALAQLQSLGCPLN